MARAPGGVSIGRLFVSRCPIRYAVKSIGEELESTPARGALKMVKDAVSWDRRLKMSCTGHEAKTNKSDP